MKLTLTQLLLAFMFTTIALANDSSAQGVLNQKMTLKVVEMPIKDVLQKIETDLNVRFSYNPKAINAHSKINFNAEEKSLSKVLDIIFKNSRVVYELVGAHQIVLSTNIEQPVQSIELKQMAVKSAHVVTGTVTNSKTNEPLIGATVSLQGTSKGVQTDEKGYFLLALDDSEKNGNLVISFVGFEALTIAIGGRTEIKVQLIEGKDLDEVIVTGSFDKRTRLTSSVAISVLNTQQIDRLALGSAADLLKNIPGVFVNSSLGEIRNTVYSRGISVGSNDGASGYYYVSLQEDGLPITGAAYDNYGPDFFLRTDATLGKLEAVRGGTASILGNNAPGGIFNYISKTGGSEFAGEARVKFGLEGDGINPYYRADLNFGGPLSSDKTLTYNIGGFYRQSDGARNPGYPINNGGQVKANLVKNYGSGSLKLYAKYLDDKNAWYEFTPTVGFENPQFAPGYSATSSVLVQGVTSDWTINESGTKVHYDSRDKVHSVDKSLGLNWNQDLGSGFTVENKARYSDKSCIWNTTGVVYPYSVATSALYAGTGATGIPGVFNFTDLATGKLLGQIKQLAGTYTVLNSNFPGADIQKNSILYNPLFYTNNAIKEFIDQLTVSKKFNNMSFTAGLYFANSNVDRIASTGAAGGGAVYSQLGQEKAQAIGISITGDDGKTYQLTNSDGVVGGGGKSANASIQTATQSQLAFFLGHNWSITPALNFDWGIRTETVTYSGTNQVGVTTTSTTGGTDGNPLTVYDNRGGKIGATYSYADRKNTTFSFSGGLNYKISENQAIYARYSQGNKAPDLSGFISINTAFLAANYEAVAQSTTQFEIGYKLRTGNTTLFATPFYSVLGNVPQSAIGQETADPSTTYRTPYVYNQYTTYGIELEADHKFSAAFGVRAVLTLQSSTATVYKTWVLGNNGAADDKTVDLSGNETDNNANVIARISPTYTSGNFFASADFSYLGSRAANVANVFRLPAFNQTNLNIGYKITSHWQLQANINNLFNQNGVMGWSAPGNFPVSLDRQGFTKAQYDANPNAVYSTLSLPARAYFMTATYKF